jgi:hypothetical protein
MSSKFSWGQGKNRPTAPRIDPRESEHVTKKATDAVRVLGEDDRVYAGDPRAPSLPVSPGVVCHESPSTLAKTASENKPIRLLLWA